MKKIENIDRAFLIFFCLIVVLAVSAYLFAGRITVEVAHFLFAFNFYDHIPIALSAGIVIFSMLAVFLLIHLIH